jgi:hypothetical protein
MSFKIASLFSREEVVSVKELEKTLLSKIREPEIIEEKENSEDSDKTNENDEDDEEIIHIVERVEIDFPKDVEVVDNEIKSDKESLIKETEIKSENKNVVVDTNQTVNKTVLQKFCCCLHR